MFKNLKILLSNSNYLVISFFAIFFFIGIFIVNDYGISSDEVDYRHQGVIILNYVVEKLFPDFIVSYLVGDKVYPPLLEYDKIYFNGSTLFHAFATGVEFISQVSTQKGQFLLKHYLTFFVSFAGLIYFYFLLKKRFLDWKLSLFGVSCLILSPKIFADFFYSPNDIIFTFFMVILCFHSLNFLSYVNYKNAVICGILSSATIAVRIMGIYVPFFIISFLIIIFLSQKDKKEIWKKYLNSMILYILITIIFYVIFAPPMWERPIFYFTTIISSAMNMDNNISDILFGGKIYLSSELPWYYLIYWISICTPILYLFLFSLGFLKIVSLIYLRKIFFWKNTSELQDYYCLGLMIIPAFATIIFHSVMFNGWRHLYFIYPFLIYISVVGLDFLLNLISKKLLLFKFLIILIIFNFLFIITWMGKNHPYQNVFFNSFAKNPQKNMELDYYGLSNREALNHILKIDDREKINVFGIGRTFLEISLRMLDDNQKKRLIIAKISKSKRFSRNAGLLRDYLNFREDNIVKADYVIANQNLDKYRNYLLSKNLDIIYEIKVDNIIINSVFKNK